MRDSFKEVAVFEFNNEAVTFNQIRYMLANFVLGNIPDLSLLSTIFNLDYTLSQLLEAITTNHIQLSISLLLEILREFTSKRKDAGIPPKIFDFLSAFLFFVGGEGAHTHFHNPLFSSNLLSRKTEKKMNAYSFFGQCFDIFPEFFNALDFALRGEMSEV